MTDDLRVIAWHDLGAIAHLAKPPVLASTMLDVEGWEGECVAGVLCGWVETARSSGEPCCWAYVAVGGRGWIRPLVLGPSNLKDL